MKKAFTPLACLVLVLPILASSQDEREREEGYVDSGGVAIHYVSMGKERTAGTTDRPLVILIHGFPDFWYTWRRQMPALAGHFRVVAIDQRGYNKSGQPTGVESYSLDRLVGDVDAVARHFEAERIIPVGHDWGGAVAWMYAMTFPEKTERLVILNMPHPKGIMRELADNPEQQRNSQYARRLQQPGAARSMEPERLVRWVQPEARPLYLEAFRRSSIEGMLHYYRANYPREGEAREFPPVRCPVLMFHGLNDQALLPATLNDTWKWIEGELTLITLPDAGHFVHHDAPERVTRRMVDWLTEGYR